MIDEMLDQTENIESDDSEEVIESSRPESVGESARAVYDQLSKSNTEEAPTEVPNEEEKQPEVTAEEQTPEQKAAEEIRARDDQGRFKKAPKGKKREVVEAAQLDTGRGVEAQPGSDLPIKSTVPVTPSKKESLDAPAMWPVVDKEWFNTQPEVVQRNALNWFKNSQAGATKLVQDLVRERDTYAASNQVYEQYRKFWPANMSRAQVDAELYESARRIKDEPYSAITEIAAARGITPQMMVDFWQKGQPPTNSATQNSQTQNNSLQQHDLDALIERKLQERQSLQQNAREATEVDALRNEKDPTGKYRYPELWDANNSSGNYWNEGYLRRLDTLVGDLQKTKGLSTAAATKEGIKVLRLLDGGSLSPSPSLQSPRISPQELQTIKAASGSVKSRGNGAIPITTGAKKGESVKESAQIVYQNLTAGKH